VDKLDEVAELLLGDYADGGLRDNPELAAIAEAEPTTSTVTVREEELRRQFPDTGAYDGSKPLTPWDIKRIHVTFDVFTGVVTKEKEPRYSKPSDFIVDPLKPHEEGFPAEGLPEGIDPFDLRPIKFHLHLEDLGGKPFTKAIYAYSACHAAMLAERLFGAESVLPEGMLPIKELRPVERRCLLVAPPEPVGEFSEIYRITPAPFGGVIHFETELQTPVETLETPELTRYVEEQTGPPFVGIEDIRAVMELYRRTPAVPRRVSVLRKAQDIRSKVSGLFARVSAAEDLPKSPFRRDNDYRMEYPI